MTSILLNRVILGCVLQAGVELPYAAIRANIADAIQLILHIERCHGKRYAAELMRIEHYEPGQDRYEFKTLFERTEYPSENGH